jgi:hypothetical protein
LKPDTPLTGLHHGTIDRQNDWLNLVRNLPVLSVDEAVAEIVQANIQHRVMPAFGERE